MIINMISFDELFSTWIFGWYILYIIGIIQYSPKYWIIIALFIVVCLALSIKLKMSIIIVGIFGIIFLKGIPLYTIRDNPCKLCDILFGLMLFIIYLIWLQYKNVDPIDIYTKRISNEQGPITTFIIYGLRNTLPNLSETLLAPLVRLFLNDLARFLIDLAPFRVTFKKERGSC